MMGAYDGGMGWWMLWGGLMMVLFWGGLIAALYYVIGGGSRPRGTTTESEPRDIAARRYAAGEIDEEEFDRIVRKLGR